jgi:hypothetical protein
LNPQKQIDVTLVSLEVCKPSVLCPELPAQDSRASNLTVPAEVASNPRSLEDSKTDLEDDVTPITGDDSQAILHRAVIFQIKRGAQGLPVVTFDELHAGVIAKHADLSRTKLQTLVSTGSGSKVFAIDAEGRVSLKEQNQEFVCAYFELADNCSQRATTNVVPASCSLTTLCHVTLSKQSLLVTGLTCQYDEDRVIFQLANNREYQLQHALQGDFAKGQMLKSVLRLR